MRLEEYWVANPRETQSAWNLFNGAVLDTGEKLGDIAPQWERDAFADTLGLPEGPAVRAGIDLVEICGPVGCGKDQIIAIAALAFVKYGPKGTRAVKQSTARDKSKEVVETALGFISRTDGLGYGVEIVRDEIRAVCHGCGKDRCMGGEECPKKGEGSRLNKVICTSLDGSAATGVRATLFLINEVQEWGYRGQSVYSHMLARYDKTGGRFVCFTNAPFTARGEWRRDRWEEARREGSDWWYRQVSVEECTWLQATLEKKRRNLSTQQFRRWYLCEPSDGRGELVTKDEMNRCVFADIAESHAPMRAGRRFLGGDLATKKDHAALVLLCLTDDGAVYLERVDVWVPTEEQDVPLPEVKEKAREYLRGWRARGFFDPHQAVQMVQELQAEGCDIETVPFTQVNLVDMCSAVRELVRNNRLRIFPNAGHTDVGNGQTTNLIQQIVDAEVKATERGERIVSQRTSAGHGDQLTAFALAAMQVVKAQNSGGAFGFGSGEDAGDPRSIRARFGDKAHRPLRRRMEVV